MFVIFEIYQLSVKLKIINKLIAYKLIAQVK
jgi:hypothetical protein